MKRWLWLLALIAVPVWGATLDGLVTALGNASGVLIAVHDTPRLLGEDYPNLHKCNVTYYHATGDVVTANTVEVLVSHYLDVGNEVAYWVRQVPEPLRVVVAQKFITDRTGGGFTLAQVMTKVQQVWAKEQENAIPAREPIRGLSISYVNGTTILVDGSFDTGTTNSENERVYQDRRYRMWLDNPNGSVTAGDANIKWRRETAG